MKLTKTKRVYTDTDRLDWMDKYEAEVSKYHTEDGDVYEVWYFYKGDPSIIFSAKTLRKAIDLAMEDSR